MNEGNKIIEYFSTTIGGFKPFLACIISAITYVLFPEQSFLISFCTLLGTMFLDIITKYWALARQHNGLMKAIRDRYISSHAMWEGTKIKVFSYMVIFILAGLSYRVAPIHQASVFLSNIIYTILFLRECQSILENLIDGGAKVGWLLTFVKKKQKEILKEDEEKEDG